MPLDAATLWVNNHLVLRRLTLADAEPMFRLINANRAHLSQFGDTTADAYPTIDSVRERIQHPANPGKLRFGIWLIPGTFIGSINLTPISLEHAEIGYWLGQQYCGKGFMKEAVEKLVAYAFSEYKEIIATVHPENIASQKVLQGTGFKETNLTINGLAIFSKLSYQTT